MQKQQADLFDNVRVPVDDEDAPNPTRLKDVYQTAEFILAGNATFTIRNNETSNRLTYRVRRAPSKSGKDFPNDETRPWFVAVLSGPDNDQHYQYLGCIWLKQDRLFFQHGRKSEVHPDAMSVKAIGWLMRQIDLKADLDGRIDIWHAGYCGRCGRLLTVPESIERGLGPVCEELVRTPSAVRR